MEYPPGFGAWCSVGANPIDSKPWPPLEMSPVHDAAVFNAEPRPGHNGMAFNLPPEMNMSPEAPSQPSQDTIVRPDGTNDYLWELQKETIIRLYWDEDKTLSEVRATMMNEYGFCAT